MSSEPDIPWAKLALYGLGSAAAILVAAAVLIVVLQPPPVLGLLIALGGLAGCVVAMAVVGRRITAAASRTDADP